MGEVYRARDPRLGRNVAIKIIPASLARDAGRLRRLAQEARADPHALRTAKPKRIGQGVACGSSQRWDQSE